jgi:retinol dehydrogenase-12
LVFKPAVYGAYTELFAGFSPSLDGSNNGAYIIPWGRISVLQDDIRAGMKGEAEGGNGKAERLCTYCKVETNPYM